jgi:AcrR family transcriptional regulator
MARPVKDISREETMAQIKAAARGEMARHGTAGISLRAIARTLGVTAPAIYNYYPRLDDLITALIVDAFTAFADAMAAAIAQTVDAGPAAQIRAAVLAMRAWAIAHPVDFQLIYGNPIPGYVAPGEVTTPLARRPFVLLAPLFAAAQAQGELHLSPAATALPPGVRTHVEQWQRSAGADFPPELVGIMTDRFAHLYGLVMLEILHHLQPSIGDTAAFFEYAVDNMLAELKI